MPPEKLSSSPTKLRSPKQIACQSTARRKCPGSCTGSRRRTPYYKDLEIARLAGYWQEALDVLGKDDPFVVRVLGGKTPLAAATAVIEGSQLDQLAERRELIDGGKAAVLGSTDPLIVLARDVYPMRRRLEKTYEVEVETPTTARRVTSWRRSVSGCTARTPIPMPPSRCA